MKPHSIHHEKHRPGVASLPPCDLPDYLSAFRLILRRALSLQPYHSIPAPPENARRFFHHLERSFYFAEKESDGKRQSGIAALTKVFANNEPLFEPQLEEDGHHASSISCPADRLPPSIPTQPGLGHLCLTRVRRAGSCSSGDLVLERTGRSETLECFQQHSGRVGLEVCLGWPRYQPNQALTSRNSSPGCSISLKSRKEQPGNE